MDSVVAESSEPIYKSTRLCSEYMKSCLQAISGAKEDSLAIEELYGRFNQWAAYIGALSVPKASLDARLAPYEDVRDMVLELLYMIYANLQWSNLDLATTAQGCTNVSIAIVGNTAEERSEASPGLPAVEAAIDRLLIIAINIRRSARRTHRLRQGTRDAQDESLCRLLVQARYPHSRKSLCNQLGTSIYVRGRSLQYLQEHNKKLAYRREDEIDPEQPETEETGLKADVEGPVVPAKSTDLKKPRVVQGPDTSPSTISPSVIARLHRTKKSPSSSIISKGLSVRNRQGNEYYYPPQPKQEDGRRYQSCTVCATPLDVLALTEQAWKYASASLEGSHGSS